MTTVVSRPVRPWRRPARHLELGAVLVVLAVPALLAFAIPQSLDASRWVTAVVGAAGTFVAYGVAAAGFFLILDGHRRLARAAAIAAVPLAAIGILVHNLLYGVTGLEEGAFFLLAILYSPALLLAALARVLLPVLQRRHARR